jgi:hypothetical protein
VVGGFCKIISYIVKHGHIRHDVHPLSLFWLLSACRVTPCVGRRPHRRVWRSVGFGDSSRYGLHC